MTVAERTALERVASFVVENNLAVVFSQRIDREDPEAGKKGRSGWNTADPWNRGELNLLAQLQSYHGQRNLLVVTQPSKVVTLDCDTEVALRRYYELGLPETATVKSGRDGKGYHFIFRPHAEGLPYSFFELAGDEVPQVTGASRTKLHVLSGFHKTGREYELVRGDEITTLPVEAYDVFARAYGHNAFKIRDDINHGQRVPASGRHDYLVQQADIYTSLGHTGVVLRAHLRVDWDLGCESDDKRDIDGEIDRIATWAERRVVQ